MGRAVSVHRAGAATNRKSNRDMVGGSEHQRASQEGCAVPQGQTLQYLSCRRSETPPPTFSDPQTGCDGTHVAAENVDMGAKEHFTPCRWERCGVGGCSEVATVGAPCGGGHGVP